MLSLPKVDYRRRIVLDGRVEREIVRFLVREGTA